MDKKKPSGADSAENRPDEENEDLLEGKNAVLEALRAGRPINKVFIANGENDRILRQIGKAAKESGAVVVNADRRKLDSYSRAGAHQGVVAFASPREYSSVSDILEIAKSRGEDPFVVICDELTDPHNLGAVIRTAESAGVHGVIIPKRRSAALSSVVSKTSAGAIEHIAVARVTNLASAINELKEAGLWVYGAAANAGATLWNTDLKGPLCLVIGSEGDGIGRLISERCDALISIPMFGKISSLNASAAAAVVIFEALRQRTHV